MDICGRSMPAGRHREPPEKKNRSSPTFIDSSRAVHNEASWNVMEKKKRKTFFHFTHLLSAAAAGCLEAAQSISILIFFLLVLATFILSSQPEWEINRERECEDLWWKYSGRQLMSVSGHVTLPPGERERKKLISIRLREFSFMECVMCTRVYEHRFYDRNKRSGTDIGAPNERTQIIDNRLCG